MNFTTVKTENGSEVETLSQGAIKLADEIQKLIDDTNATKLINIWKIGKLINDVYGDQKDYGSGQMENIAKRLNLSVKTLYRYKQIFELFDEKSIKRLAKEKFSTPYNLVRTYGNKGSEKFMEIYQKATSLADFKVRLKEQWPKSKTNEQTGTPGPLKEISDINTQRSGDHSKTETDSEKSPAGDNSMTSSEKGPSPDPIVKTDETPSQDEEGEEPESGDPLDTGKGSPSESDQKPEPDKNEPKEDANAEHKRIKQQVGSTVEIEPPTSESSGGTADEILENCHVDQTGTDEETMMIKRSEYDQLHKKIEEQELEINRLRKENETLRADNTDLRNENNELKKIILIGSKKAHLNTLKKTEHSHNRNPQAGVGR